MSDLRKAAEMALEYLNKVSDWDTTYPVGKAREALRQALAQPEQEQKTPLKVLNLTVFTENRLQNGRVYDVETLQAMTNRDILAIPDMGKKALAEVLEALNVHAVNMSQERVDETAKREHEPWPSVQCVCGGTIYFKYTPPVSDYHEGWEEGFKAGKREWVGLTDQEIEDLWNQHESRFDYYSFSCDIEAKLKEKNGG